ncbi:MAG: ATP-binding protein [Gammaproteobacteria bacterium]|nr:ATP-binding protein [Gammaproteobacteria bacterium]
MNRPAPEIATNAMPEKAFYPDRARRESAHPGIGVVQDRTTAPFPLARNALLELPGRLWQRLTWPAKSMIFVLLVIALIYALIAIFLYSSVRNDLTGQVQTELQRLTGNLAASATDPLLLKDGGALGKLAEARNPLVERITIADRQGIVVASGNLSRLGQIQHRRLPNAAGYSGTRFYAPIVAGGQRLGAVWVDGNSGRIHALVNARLDRTRNRLLILGGITALMGLLGAYLVSRAVTRPVLRLLGEIESMEAQLRTEDRPTPAPPHIEGDELHRLDFAFKRVETRLREHLNELNQLHRRQQAMQCMATIGEMSAQVAHEIRNALSSLRGAARFLVRYGDDKNRDEFLRIIEEEVKRLYDMTQGFLDFGRPYAALRVEAEILPLLTRSAARHGADLEAKSIGISIQCAPGLHAVLDASLLEQAISNLLLNAIDAVPSAGGEITLYAVADVDQSVLIGVRDNGPGIPGDKIQTIFKPYVTTKTKGSGLGLAVVTKIMMVHDGQVELRPSAEGADFVLRLPRHPHPPPQQN